MKKLIKFRIVSLLALTFMFFSSGILELSAQTRARIKADYVKVLGEESYLDISVSARVDKKNVGVGNVDLIITNVIDDEILELGILKTDMAGNGRFVIKDFNSIKADTSQAYTIRVAFEGNSEFRKATRNVNFRDAEIITELTVLDSINHIKATLIDKGSNSPIANTPVLVQVKRIFRALPIGEEYLKSDENGTILVPIPNDLPGVNGVLNIEVLLEDSDDYATVISRQEVPAGITVVDESDFDDRTMWSTRSKTPLFLLIFPNLIILGMWGYILYLVFNLFKIYNSQKHENN